MIWDDMIRYEFRNSGASSLSIGLYITSLMIKEPLVRIVLWKGVWMVASRLSGPRAGAVQHKLWTVVAEASGMQNPLLLWPYNRSERLLVFSSRDSPLLCVGYYNNYTTRS